MSFEQKITDILRDNNLSKNAILKKQILTAYFDEWTIESKDISNKMRIIKIDNNGCIQI